MRPTQRPSVRRSQEPICGLCQSRRPSNLHRTRHLFIRQQTSVINAIRAHLAEFGVTAAVGRKGIEELLRVIADPSDKRVPDVVRTCLAALGSQLLSLKKQILDFDRMIMAWHRSNQTSKRLNCIPGVGPLLATALVASVADPKTFRSGRNFSAWIGLVPNQHSSGGRDRLGSISKQGDRYLRSLFVAGALAVIRYAKIHGTKYRPWVAALLARRPTKVAAIALANKPMNRPLYIRTARCMPPILDGNLLCGEPVHGRFGRRLAI